jgi:hypothetical protein
MPSADSREEHFVTLFDSHFLAAGLCLYRSLKAHAGAFRLWIVCMDEKVEAQLRELALPEVRLLPLAEVQTPELKRVRPDRTIAEYCWTLTPFTPSFVMEREPGVRRVTYLDADLYFFADPRRLLGELDASGAQVLITPHAYAPEYDQTSYSGIYCVQFVAFANSAPAREVLRWWQERCIEWCYQRSEDGKFGDQKYLDDWPQRFAGTVHVLQRTELALGPWNASRFLRDDTSVPVFFHFHGLRVVSPTRLLLYMTYRLDATALRLYDRYIPEFVQALGAAFQRWGEIPGMQRKLEIRERLLRAWNRARGTLRYARYRIG